MLIQMDGSHHPWLGDRMLPFTLLIAVDDATGTVVDALFCDHEDTSSYFRLMQGLWTIRLPLPISSSVLRLSGLARRSSHHRQPALGCRLE